MQSPSSCPSSFLNCDAGSQADTSNVLPESKKHKAELGAIRPGCEVATVMVWCINSSSMPKSTPRAYCSSVSVPTRATMLPQAMGMVRRDCPTAISPMPESKNPNAVLYCIGANCGSTWTRLGLWVYQPNSTASPSALAKAPHHTGSFLKKWFMMT